jgi:antitoxin component HigA of HigAB toxin-antitoxin module
MSGWRLETKFHEKLPEGVIHVRQCVDHPGVIVTDTLLYAENKRRRSVIFNGREYLTISEAVRAWDQWKIDSLNSRATP